MSQSRLPRDQVHTLLMVAMHDNLVVGQKALGVCHKVYNHEQCKHCQTSAFLCLTDPACIAGDYLPWTPFTNSADGLYDLNPGENPTPAVDWLRQTYCHTLNQYARTSGERRDQAPTDKISVINSQPLRYHLLPAFLAGAIRSHG